MKQKIQKKINKQLFTKNTLILLLISIQSTPTTCVTNNNNTKTQQIEIYSNYQNIDITKNTLTISKNVVIQTNYINIYADKIFITYSNMNNKIKTINAYGDPVIYYQFKENKKHILATSLHVSYKTYNDTIILKGKVYLKKENYTLQSDYITYVIKNKYIEAYNPQSLNKTILTINTHN